MANEVLVLTDPCFRLAVGYAKALARHSGSRRLTPRLLLGGFHAAAGSKFASVPAALKERLPRLADFAAAAGIEVPSDLTPADDEKFPLDPELQATLRDYGSCVGSFLDGLLDRAQLPKDIKSGPFHEIMKCASAIARAAGAESVHSETFAAGTYMAFGLGLLNRYPSVAALVAANASTFEALIAESDYDLAGDLDPAAERLPLGEELSKQIAASKADPLFAAVNAGLSVGSRVLAKHRVAYHEAGHAVASHVLRPELPVLTVSIIDEGDADGITSYDPDAPFWNRMRASDLSASLCVALAGRAAERIKFGLDQMDSGASADLTQATRIAWRGISRFGLDEGYCPVDLTCLTDNFNVSSGWLFDEAQRRLAEVLRQAAVRADEVLRANWALVEALAMSLYRKKKIEFEEFIESIKHHGLSGVPGAVSVEALPVRRAVRFAVAPGVQMTAEGAVRYDAGDALVSEGDGPEWPVRRGVFDRTYVPAGGQDHGMQGLYDKVTCTVTAVQILDFGRVDLSQARGVLLARSGDWLVDYGDGDVSVVSRDAFASTYRMTVPSAALGSETLFGNASVPRL